jgi:hypothetical protein
MEQDELSNITKKNDELNIFDKIFYTSCSSRCRAGSSRSALICFGSRSSSVTNERCQRFRGKYHAPYRYFRADGES